MFVTAKRIPIHPSKARDMKPGDKFETPSGMGGSFTVVFKQFEGNRAVFTIEHHSNPPDGWNGEQRTFLISELEEKIHGICPDNPFYDGGKQELKTLKALGYPEESGEIQKLRRACPKLPIEEAA